MSPKAARKGFPFKRVLSGIAAAVIIGIVVWVGLPLLIVPLPWPCPNEVYEERMRGAIDIARGDGVTHVAFGDLFLEEIRAYRERQMAEAVDIALEEGVAGIIAVNTTISREGLRTPLAEVEELGAGEILLTSIDQDGARSGYEIALTRAVADSVPVPVIASGGAGRAEHLRDAFREGDRDLPGFLDFTTLERRRHFCEEEVRLNRRLAPELYLDVVPVSGPPDTPRIGGEPAIEYAVLLRQFDPDATVDRKLARDEIAPDAILRLAATVAQFHRQLPPAEGSSPERLALENVDEFEAAVARIGITEPTALNHSRVAATCQP